MWDMHSLGDALKGFFPTPSAPRADLVRARTHLICIRRRRSVGRSVGALPPRDDQTLSAQAAMKNAPGLTPSSSYCLESHANFQVIILMQMVKHSIFDCLMCAMTLNTKLQHDKWCDQEI
jgi:hypothetical protein